MEGEDDHGPATAQLTLLQVDLEGPPEDELNQCTGNDVASSVKLKWSKNISDYWLAPDTKSR
jgi:hypothetical protein